MIINLSERNPDYINQKLEELNTKIKTIKTNDKYFTASTVIIPLLTGLNAGINIGSSDFKKVLFHTIGGTLLTSGILIVKAIQSRKKEKLQEEYNNLYIQNETNKIIQEETKKRIKRRF